MIYKEKKGDRSYLFNNQSDEILNDNMIAYYHLNNGNGIKYTQFNSSI